MVTIESEGRKIGTGRAQQAAPLPVAERIIGPGNACFIIAEAGVNHNGDLALAKRLIDIAAESGADAVKFQTWSTERLLTQEAPLAGYQQANVGAEQSQFAMLKQLELSHPQFHALKTRAEERGILFFSTPDEEYSADFLERLDVPVFKIGSGEVTNLPLLRHIALKGRPMLLSTGMATLEEVEAAVREIEATGNRRLALLHCVSDYPANPADCNLRAMETLSTAFGYPVGFSDHTCGIEIALAAVARGACILEKHFTLDKTLPGPDHRASLDPAELMEMVRAVRAVESALGDGLKRPVPSELETRKVVRKSVVAARTIRQGEKITLEEIALRRSNGGLGPDSLPLLIGRCALCEIAANSAITLDLLS